MNTKLRLDPDALRVDTFATGREEGERGTVRARAFSDPIDPTCARTCGIPPAHAPRLGVRATYGCDPVTELCCM